MAAFESQTGTFHATNTHVDLMAERIVSKSTQGNYAANSLAQLESTKGM